MALDLGPKLETSLRDTTNQVWGATEIDDILAFALEETNRVRPRTVTDTVPLVADTDTYVLTNVYEVHRVDLIDPNSKLVMHIPQGAWELWGDNYTAGQTLYVNPRYARTGYSLRIHGYAPYTFSGTTNPPLQVQQAILALARAEALRRVATERSRFEQYATANPRSDTSMAELLQQVNESDAEGQRLLSAIRLIKKPVSARS